MSDIKQLIEEKFRKGFTINLTEPIKKQKIRKALGYVAGQATLNAEQEADFLTTVQSAFLSSIRTDAMSSATKTLESLNDQSGNVRRVEPGVELSSSGSVSAVTNTLTTKPLGARYFVSYDWLNENALTATSEGEVMSALEGDLMRAYENDIAKLAFTGSDDGGSGGSSTLIGSLDGLIAAALDDSNVVKATGSIGANRADAVHLALQAEKNAYPDKYQMDFDNFKTHMSIGNGRFFSRALQVSGSGDLKHIAITDGGKMFHENVEIVPTQYCQDYFMLSTTPENIVRGRGIDLNVKPVDEPGKFGWDIFLYSKEGFQFVKSEKVILTRVSGSGITNWAANTV